MKVENLRKYYVFGWNTQILSKGGSGGYLISQVIEILNEFEDFIKEHDLQVTSRAVSNDLHILRKELKKLVGRQLFLPYTLIK